MAVVFFWSIPRFSFCRKPLSFSLEDDKSLTLYWKFKGICLLTEAVKLQYKILFYFWYFIIAAFLFASEQLQRKFHLAFAAFAVFFN